MPTLRLLSYNIRSMRDDRAALARVIKSVDPHVVCVQEAPRFLRWRSTCAALARTSGLVVAGGGRPAAANLLLCTLSVDVVKTRDVLFSKTAGLHQRGTSIAVLSLAGVRFAVAGTHLDLKANARLRHIRELDAAIGAHVPEGVAVIVAADVNDDPTSETWRALSAGRTDALASAAIGSILTSPARRARQTIDGVFVDPRLLIKSARVLDTPDVASASDHRPILVEIELSSTSTASAAR
ncbi:MAG: endonuclease/exonuclease/phosphatase family protein [Actinomycetota bacterium]|nr:endonuclease/exonuclease/phosphatase family protein [Actinomycetota bacterium]